MTEIAVKFNWKNRSDLWALRDYHGHSTLKHTFCTSLGELQHVTAEHADRLILAGQNVYVDVPLDPDCPLEQYRPGGV